MPLPEPRFPSGISPTQMSAFKACPQQWFWRYCMRVQPAGRGEHLIAGAAFADALRVARSAFFDLGKPAHEAYDLGLAELERSYREAAVGPDAWLLTGSPRKSLTAMLGGFRWYMDIWPLESEYFKPKRFGGEHGIEFNFEVPTHFKHPDTGEPLPIRGRLDVVAEYRDGVLWAFDDKTSTELGPKWRSQWELDSQITCYVWAAQQFGFPVAGAVVRGLGILQTKYKTDEVMCPRSGNFLRMWERQMHYVVGSMLAIYAEQSFIPRTLDKSTCGAYGGCPYVRPCASDNAEPWLEGMLAEYAAPAADPAVDFAEFLK